MAGLRGVEPFLEHVASSAAIAYGARCESWSRS
jgi:hypothetical protein